MYKTGIDYKLEQLRNMPLNHGIDQHLLHHPMAAHQAGYQNVDMQMPPQQNETYYRQT
jgi:hypothetical protein